MRELEHKVNKKAGA